MFNKVGLVVEGWSECRQTEECTAFSCGRSNQSINIKGKNIIAGLATKSVKSSGTNLTRPIRNLLTNIERTQTNENTTCVLDWSGVLN